MKQLKVLVTTALSLALVLNITKQVKASDSYISDDVAPSYIEVKENCTMPDGTQGVISDCAPAKLGRCNVPQVRRCSDVD